ncbi:UV DNA damage repair endonuclease UvsE [Aquibacillus koreensis]|uniref:UV DNA damage repair endonuclease UvsE n=1 Tax=Aquibacillus koreensis TaxID=279446 RepID=A0A9X4AKC9_9BACI|nr:UV DNA damage repair endonuclease UvsE [Aquibacillus koreensis]MCT2536334.1 UV DNA damage repair endonuclease UvsE [Aquibacillus koreensis]MDC3421315.1 UV DNA damage repair endonuclease UvsE [Aquibacillus koreensis]
MTVFRFGYVAMSKHVKNSSPSQTMTYTNFEQHKDREAAIRRLEKIANTNIENCIRLLKHNQAFDISLFRLSSRLIPLANHEELADWNYLKHTKESLRELGNYARDKNMRIGFHPDHFVVLNSLKQDIVKNSVQVLKLHYDLLKAMGINTMHRCVLHVGGSYGNKMEALERFIDNWGRISTRIQQTIILENDDKTYNVEDVLYLCEKLSVPLVFDLHHHLANHEQPDWMIYWERIIDTWKNSPLPVKVHLSSPKSDKEFRSHADYVDGDFFIDFAKKVNGSVPQVDCMIEAKQKDEALFKLIRDLKERKEVEMVDQSSIRLL